MTEAIETYRTRVHGLWSPRHELLAGPQGEERLGVLAVRRNGLGMVVAGEWRPEKGEVLAMRRDPGLLRAQFSLWTESREWLGSSLRWSPLRRQIEVWTSGKPLRMVPMQGLRRGWRLIAPKTGEAVRIDHGLLGRGARIELYRKTDFELVLFAYFLGAMVLSESRLPTTLETFAGRQTPAASGA